MAWKVPITENVISYSCRIVICGMLLATEFHDGRVDKVFGLSCFWYVQTVWLILNVWNLEVTIIIAPAKCLGTLVSNYMADCESASTVFCNFDSLLYWLTI